jgi:fructokinase
VGLNGMTLDALNDKLAAIVAAHEGFKLKAVAEEAGIDMSGLRMDDTVHTTLAFVKTYEDGDRDFSFYRNPGADMMLTEDELPMDMIRDTRIFHFGTLSMTHEGVRQATRAAVLAAKQAGAIISFDPNLRPPLWDSLNEARTQMLWGLSQADVVKIADNEIEFLTDTSDYDKGARLLRERFPGIRLLNVTAGANGSYAFCGDRKTFVPSFLLGGTIETTGAGDTFCASVLDFVLAHGTDGLSKDDLKAMLRFANAAAYLVTTRRGAIRSMPQRQQVEAILKEH